MKYTKYEKARMLGARALQISMGAPMLVKLSEKELEELKYSPLEIAKKEFEQDKIPIEIKRSIPKPKEAAKEQNEQPSNT